jgi:hypothetical protein
MSVAKCIKVPAKTICCLYIVTPRDHKLLETGTTTNIRHFSFSPSYLCFTPVPMTIGLSFIGVAYQIIISEVTEVRKRVGSVQFEITLGVVSVQMYFKSNE